MSYDIFSSSDLHLKFDQNLKKSEKKTNFKISFFWLFFKIQSKIKKDLKKILSSVFQEICTTIGPPSTVKHNFLIWAKFTLWSKIGLFTDGSVPPQGLEILQNINGTSEPYCTKKYENHNFMWLESFLQATSRFKVVYQKFLFLDVLFDPRYWVWWVWNWWFWTTLCVRKHNLTSDFMP